MPTEILLIDPDAITRRLLKYHLQRAGYVVHEAMSGEVALDYASRSSVVIADEAALWGVTMESAIGIGANQFAHLPALILTNVPHRNEHATRTYLAKPVRAVHVLQCVAALIGVGSY